MKVSRPRSYLLLCSALFLASITQAEVKRTTSGHPDLSGTYDAATLTPLQRPEELGDALLLTAEEAQKLADDARESRAATSQDSDPNREAPPQGGDGSPGAAGNVGGYNTFWLDRGTDAFAVDGKFRTSIIVDPKNGRLPTMTPVAAKRQAAFRETYTRENSGTAWWIEDDVGPYDNMEQRNVAERCLLGFTGAVPTLPSGYNNFKRIVQTEDHVMILIEMVHDARIIRMNSEHQPAGVQKWLGDSIGWWEGDTLVAETINFRPESNTFQGGTVNTKVVERFTMQEDGNVLYRFTMEDDTVWERPWTGEYIWRASDQPLYEYACHEGNYSFGNIMRGARILERDWLTENGGAE